MVKKMKKIPYPEKKLWELHVHRTSEKDGITGLCIGYEDSKWRKSHFSNTIMSWLPEFALNSSEREAISAANATEFIEKAAGLVYSTDTFKSRGDFGELFLHAAMRSIFESNPVISKIFYKSASNDTVKGFDCVHVVGTELENLELWLGEAKFYSNFPQAMRQVIEEIKNHTTISYLREEFVLISNKVDNSDDFANHVKDLLCDTNSLDQVIKRICIPIFITYNSETVKNHSKTDDVYINNFKNEIEKNYKLFLDSYKIEIKFHLFLFPLKDKESLNEALDKQLKRRQSKVTEED